MEKSPKFSTDDIIKYMNEKYGVTFTYIEPVDANQPTATSLAIFLEEPTHPGKRIFAKYETMHYFCKNNQMNRTF